MAAAPADTAERLTVREVLLRGERQLSFVWRYPTRDITKNQAPAAALAQLAPLIGGDFGSAHLFTTTQDAQLEFASDGTAESVILASFNAG